MTHQGRYFSKKMILIIWHVQTCKQKINGAELTDANDFWQDIRDHRHFFFGRNDKPLWRFSLPPSSDKFVRIDSDQFIEWGGAQRWVHSNAPANIIHSIASSRQGFATLFRGDLPGCDHFGSPR
jgi:glycolate oxidase FAD binding subunit